MREGKQLNIKKQVEEEDQWKMNGQVKQEKQDEQEKQNEQKAREAKEQEKDQSNTYPS